MILITDCLESKANYKNLTKTGKIQIGKRYSNDSRKKTPYYRDRWGNYYHLFYDREYLNTYHGKRWVYAIEEKGLSGSGYIYIALNFWEMLKFKIILI